MKRAPYFFPSVPVFGQEMDKPEKQANLQIKPLDSWSLWHKNAGLAIMKTPSTLCLMGILSAFILPATPLTFAAPTHLVEEAPVKITNASPGVFLVDFGKVAFGNLRVVPPADANKEITIHFGEALTGGRIDRKPPGSVRYSMTKITLSGTLPLVAAPRADARNTKPPAVLTPAAWGVVLPFRWVEIEGWPGTLRPEQLRRQAAFSSTWDDDAASFHCSDDLLNRIWELCRYSIKATTFAGVYVDGDRFASFDVSDHMKRSNCQRKI